MENFNGIFIATTNLMDNLDQASLRRFDLKLKLDYLLPEQSWLLFQEECSLVDTSFSNKDRDEILRLRNLTPGDFATVRRQHAFQPIQSSKEFVIRLKEEIKVKQVGNSQLIGFVK
jgi:SpoVK/Ycf46/Vps4 family AAA+-type ATPase